ncbi:alpha/beta hydrolase [Nibrella saemangeumensis]|uniref:alpha/beta fold hydrolase n=1 Tax=Nibrella saemangeumensis TaxID=1084526 RepID=UPI0031ED0200
MKRFHFLLLTLLMASLTGCFRRWTMTEKDLRQHYANRITKPVYHTVENDTMKLFCASFGPDTLPPLLFIHGAPGSWYGYLPLLDDSLLQQRFHLISVDRPGYGKSQKRRHPITSINQQASWIAEALKLNKSGKPAIVLGRSYGAPIAARLAMLYPSLVKHLLMVAPPIDPDREKFFWFSWWGKLPLVKLFLPRSLNTATAEKYAHVAELKQLQSCWSGICLPVTVMQGGNDWLVDPANLDYARQVLADTQTKFIFLPEAGHLITESHPNLVRKMILEAVDRTSGL